MNSGEAQTFVITPDAGYGVADVLVDGVSAGAVITYEFPSVNADHTIHVTFAYTGYHHADYNPSDYDIGLSELLRVIQLYNEREYHCDPDGEDGYNPGEGDKSCTPHHSDYDPQDWTIGLSEILRIIQLYNNGGYHADADGEDGFSPGKEGPAIDTDSDHDGYTEAQGDCADNDAGVHPGATEVCDDGKDNDCDGALDCTDTDCSGNAACGTCTDADADNYYAETGCGTEQDCDDTDAAVHPGASEICDDGKDNDCDGTTDCADADCAGDVCDQIQIRSVEADRYVPFSPIDILVDGVDLLGKGRGFNISFNDVNIPLDQINYETGVVSTLIPELPGQVAIQITSDDGFATNTVSITVEAISLPEGVTVEGVVADTIEMLDDIIADVRAKTSEEGISPEEEAAVTELADEISAAKEIVAYFLEESAPEDRELFAALMANSGAMDSEKVRSGRKAARSPFTSSRKYEDILRNRRIVERNNMVSATLNVGWAGVSAAISPPIAAVLAGINMALAFEKANFWQPAVLSDFTVEITEPGGGLYRDSEPPVTVFKGTFTGLMGKTEAFSRMLMDISWAATDLSPLGKTRLSGKLADMGDGVITDALKETLNSAVDVEKAKNWHASIMAKLDGKMVTWGDVAFDISDFQKVINYPKNEALAEWNQDTWQILFQRPGEVRMTFIVIDPLGSEKGQTLANELNFEVKNHFPEVTGAPGCVVTADGGKCSFTLDLSDGDTDDQDKLWAELAENGQASFGYAEGDITGFTYDYDENAPPRAEDVTVTVKPGGQVMITLRGGYIGGNDKVVLKYGDPYEYDTVEVSIDLSALQETAASYDIRQNPGKGRLDEIIGDRVRYTANADAQGSDSFPYYAVNDDKYSDPATVTIVIGACTDADSDNYYAESDCGTEVDCNDNDVAVHPGASEICDDGKDNDCDGAADCDDSEDCGECATIKYHWKGNYTLTEARDIGENYHPPSAACTRVLFSSHSRSSATLRFRDVQDENNVRRDYTIGGNITTDVCSPGTADIIEGVSFTLQFYYEVPSNFVFTPTAESETERSGTFTGTALYHDRPQYCFGTWSVKRVEGLFPKCVLNNSDDILCSPHVGDCFSKSNDTSDLESQWNDCQDPD